MPSAIASPPELNSLRFLESQFDQTARTDQGTLLVRAFARVPGTLRYFNADGSQRIELVTPQLNQSFDSEGFPAVRRLGDLPVTLEHPPELLRGDAQMIDRYQVGRTKPKVRVYHDGKVEVLFEVFDSEAIRAIEAGEKTGVSMGYRCRVVPQSGTWNGMRYDAMQSEPIEWDHIAIVARPRAPEARITEYQNNVVPLYRKDGIDDIAWAFDGCGCPDDGHGCGCSACKAKQKKSRKKPFTIAIGGVPMRVDAQEFNAIVQAQTKQGRRLDGMNDFYGVLDRFRARMDKAPSGKSKTCPGGYKIPVSKNCRRETGIQKTRQQSQALREKHGMTKKAPATPPQGNKKQKLAPAATSKDVERALLNHEVEQAIKTGKSNPDLTARVLAAKAERKEAERAEAKKEKRSEAAKKSAATRKANSEAKKAAKTAEREAPQGDKKQKLVAATTPADVEKALQKTAERKAVLKKFGDFWEPKTSKKGGRKKKTDSLPMNHLEARRFARYLSARIGA